VSVGPVVRGPRDALRGLLVTPCSAPVRQPAECRASDGVQQSGDLPADAAIAYNPNRAIAQLSRQEEAAFRALVKAAFAHRRKTLVNSLRDEGYELHSVAETLQRLNIAPTRRAETLSVEDFLRLARALG